MTTETNPMAPQPGIKTSSFKVVLMNGVAPIVTILIGLAVQLGYIEPDAGKALDASIQEFLLLAIGLVSIGFAWVSGKYIEGRSKVSQEKARAITDNVMLNDLGQAI